MGRRVTVVIACLAAVSAAFWLVVPRVPDVPPAPPAQPVTDVTLAQRVFAPTETERSAVAARPTESASPTLPLTRENVQNGAVLYTRVGCVVCHGVAAEGVAGPRIARTELSLGAVRQQVRIPRHPRMPSFAPEQLSDAGIAAIYAFLQSLGR